MQIRNTYLDTKYSFKSSRYGFSCIQNSRKTPYGKHVVTECIGGGVHPNTFFKSRKPAGHWLPSIAKDVVTARIVRLKGIVAGINDGYDANKRCVDTFMREIYIHGVPDLIFESTDFNTYGSIVLQNNDMIQFFDEVREIARSDHRPVIVDINGI